MNINRLIFPGFWFGKTKREDALELAKRGVGGFCIYGGSSEKEVAQLIADLRAASPLKHLFICADYEDGLGKWIPGTSWVLSNLAVGASGSAEIAYQKGLTLAREARKLGVDWIFAPVLDLCDEPQNPIVNTRSFGKDPQLVAQLGAALCRGLRDGGVLNSIKHFPGHGATTQDSHLGLPVLKRTREQLEANELIPFHNALPVADSVMVGHLLLPEIDSKNPTSLSRVVMTDLLKKQLGFNGLVLTDALCMKAIGDEKQAALQALQAGAHVLLCAEDSLALSDFLQQQNGLENFAEISEKLQEELISRLQKPVQPGLSAADFNTHYAVNCAAWIGQKITLTPNIQITYLELGNEEDFTAKAFLAALQKQGVQIKKYDGESCDILLAVSFSNYKAFKGHINLSPSEQSSLSNAAAHSKQSVFISFGSPFGTENINTLSTRLFCFSPAEEMQLCAAEILCGRKEAKGTLPFKSLPA